MAKTETQETPDELRNLANTTMEQRDRFELGVVQGHKSEVSRGYKERLREQTLFKFLAPLWGALSPEEKLVWKTAGAVSNITGWQLFISDNAQRLRYGLTLGVPPSDIWQVRTGRILITAPANGILLKQEHPRDYWVSRKKRGQPWKQELVFVTEQFGLPLDIEIRYKTDLEINGGVQSARFFAKLKTSYQSRDEEYEASIDLEPSEDWTTATVSLTSARGIVIGYTIFIEIIGYRGEIFLDNGRAIHGGTNWIRDPRFDAMDKVFTKAFSVVKPFWEVVELDEGASYETVYPPSL